MEGVAHYNSLRIYPGPHSNHEGANIISKYKALSPVAIVEPATMHDKFRHCLRRLTFFFTDTVAAGYLCGTLCRRQQQEVEDLIAFL